MEKNDNVKQRLLYCPQCHKDFENDISNAQCPDCKRPLLTVAFVDGIRLTGRVTYNPFGDK